LGLGKPILVKSASKPVEQGPTREPVSASSTDTAASSGDHKTTLSRIELLFKSLAGAKNLQELDLSGTLGFVYLKASNSFPKFAM
jgi:hypothetical protein